MFLIQCAHMNTDAPENTPRGPIKTGALVVVAMLIMCPASAIYVAVCLLLIPWRALRIRTGNTFGKIMGPTIFGLAGIRPAIENRERMFDNFPALYVCNHTSTVDMWIGMWMCPNHVCGVAKKEIMYLPFFGQAYWLSGHLLLDRTNRERAIASMAKAREVIHKHRLGVWMWPEGTRSRDGRLQPLKKGFVHLAIAAGLPIVPVVFHDADIHWPSKKFRTVPGDLRIEVLEAIDTSSWSPDQAKEHAQEVWQRLQDALGPRQKGLASET